MFHILHLSQLRSNSRVWHLDPMRIETHPDEHAALQPVFSEGRLIIPVKGSHSGGFMVVLTQLDMVLVLWQVKTQVPVRLGKCFTACKQTHPL